MNRVVTRTLLAAATFVVVLALPALLSGGAAGPSTDLGLARALASRSALAFAVAFAGGVLTSLTPCVYPLIPITVSIFGARRSGSRGQAMALSGLYVLGIALTYSALGAFAALTGNAFGSAMRSPWVLGGVSLFLLAMAASMLGAFDLQLPASWRARLSGVGGAGHAGALAMGMVAGLVAAPCTGPVLAAALAFVATQGSVAYGVAIMFAYALGIGSLFFVIGAFSVSLPKGGPWMDAVKGIFGVALLAMALLYAKDLVPGIRPLFRPERWAELAGAAAAAIGILLGAVQGTFERPWRHRLAKGAGVALVAAGTVYALASASAREAAPAAGIAWLVNREPDGIAIARAQNRPVIIDFWGDWCAACKELDRTAWADPAVQAEARRFVAIKIDNSAEKLADPATSAAVDRVFDKYGILGQPTVVLIDAKGHEVPGRITAAISAQEMLRQLKAVDRACASSEIACVDRW